MIDTRVYDEIGLTEILALLAPKTPWGRAQKRALRPLLPAERPLLDALLSDADAAASYPDPSALLSPFREILGLFSALEERALSAVELFELKRFLLQAERLQTALAPLPPLSSGAIPDLAPAFALLDPDGRRDPAFMVTGTDGSLAELRRQKRLITVGTARFLELTALEEAEELKLRGALSRALEPLAPLFTQACAVIGRVDFACAEAALIRAHGCVKPVFCDGAIEAAGLRNPQIAHFVPLTLTLPRGATVVTGANMGGKSCCIKTVLLNVLLAHMGLFVFADRFTTPVFGELFLIAGSLEDGGSGLSDFGGQLSALKTALAAAEGDALILIDELARGTNPEEGAAIAMATTEHLAACRAISVISTHYSGVARFATVHYRAKGLRADARADDIGSAMQYGFVRADGSDAPPRDAIRVCRLMGVPEEIVARAEEFC